MNALGVALQAVLGEPVARTTALSGGDINDAYRVELRSGRALFVKTRNATPAGFFEAEAQGLRWLAEARCLRVPEVLAVADTNEAERQRPAFLVLELIEPAQRQPGFDERLGRGLAALHRSGAPNFGLSRDNFIGSLPQPNAPRASWAEFYQLERLEPQARQAVRAGALPETALKHLEQLFKLLPGLVGPDEPPARLHGDLWSGNIYTDELGEPCLIDPAVYGGHREMDLAMMRLFGGFGPRVFAAYEESYPLTPGAAERVALYQLYPLLVHANLFGGSYGQRALQDLRRFA